jgi:hypothetical protein
VSEVLPSFVHTGLILYFPARRRGKGKGKQVEEDPTRELHVNRIIPVTTTPQTWTVPRDEVAYKLDVRANPDVLKNKKGNKMRTIDAYIKAEVCCFIIYWEELTRLTGPG